MQPLPCRHVKVRSGFLVNRLLSQVDRWESIFTVFRDLEPLFDHINLSTALHRLARTSYKHRVRPLIRCTGTACVAGPVSATRSGGRP